MTDKTLHEKLADIQQKLKAPKGQYNSYSKFYYRSCEDILEAVKPLLNGLLLTISDDVINIGTMNYVKATVTISDKTEKISTTALAREATDRKGMDDAQITGSSSSYARKYALNGLFLIDDTKDADTQDNTVKPTMGSSSPIVDTDPEWVKNEEQPIMGRKCSVHNIPLLRGVSKTKLDKEGNPKVYWYHMVDNEMCFGNKE